MLLLSLAPPAGRAVNARSDQVAYLTWGRRHWSDCAVVPVPGSPWDRPQMTSPRAAIHSRWTSARELAVAIMTALHFASSCSSSILVQREDRGGLSLPWSPCCTPLLPHLGPQVSPHQSACLWLLAWGAKDGSVEDAQGRRLPLALSPGVGSLFSPAELETGHWGQSGE